MKKAIKCLLIPVLILFLLFPLTTGVFAITLTDIQVPKLVSTPVIDGVYDPAEGWGNPIVSVKFADALYYLSDKAQDGNADLVPTSTQVYLRWDEKNCYFCCISVDDVHFNDSSTDDPANAWAGDAMQFDIKSDVADDDTGNRNRFFYGVNNDGVLVAYQDKVEEGSAGEIGVDCAWDQCVVKRDESTKTTTYETAFSWARALPAGKIGENDAVLLRAILLLTHDAGTEDACDLNYPGVIEGDYLYWKATLTGQPAAELAANVAAEEPVSTDVSPETAEAALPAEPAAAAQTSDIAVIAALVLLVSVSAFAAAMKSRKITER